MTGSGTSPSPAARAACEQVNGELSPHPTPIAAPAPDLLAATQEEAWWTPIVEEFNQQYPKVEVQVVQQPWSGREQALTTAIAGKTAPDVVYFNPDFVPRYADQDLLLDLGKAMESERDAFVPSSLEAYTYNDTLYAFPLLMTVSNPGYNVEVLEKIGLSAPPRTFDEIRAAAEACVRNDFTFAQYTAADGSLNHTFYPFLWTAGGTPLSDDETMSAFAGPEGLKALQLLRDVADLQAWDPEGLTQPIGKFEQTKFARGTELMGLTLGIPEATKIMGEGVAKGADPFFDTEEVVFGSVGGLSIFNTTESPEASVAWVKFLTSEGPMKKFLEASNYLPPRTSLQGMWDGNEDNSFKSQFLEQVNVGVLHPKAREMMDLMRPHLQGCLLGRVEPQATLDAAAEQVDALLARG
ncbi:extracellular solute-binding protein [Parenemella sanctibonifatiensis]|uniref:Sugar ABC transporter substrate-binding protein n=1 Tax=Parenemella sanctibonifatiensis TaxID=2016505 RepID=A0A255EL17_9ACTN|nr:extracellular solute-binding protein [Parenemella sanctibonifatiensis]OYN88833.1 hypothetical protein CGZ92_03775 [Parenemella sanctibonifatiensis]